MSQPAAASPSSSLTEYWLGLREQYEIPEFLEYRPAVVFECLLDFRDVRAELVDRAEQLYSTWLPEADLAVDWSKPACSDLSPEMLESQPRPGIRPSRRLVRIDPAYLERIENDLIDHLTRCERKRVLFNPNFRAYSRMSESDADFLNRLWEEGNSNLQAELKELTHSLQLQLEQLRESQLPKGLSDEKTQQLRSAKRRAIAQMGNRLNEIIWAKQLPTLGELFHAGTTQPVSAEIHPLEDELRRLEEETFERIRQLSSSYKSRVVECYDYFVGLHPNNIQIIRRGILWVPTLG